MTSSSTEPEERVSQIEFWKLNSVQASIEEMLLDSRAEEISKFEVPEILGYLGPFVKELKRTKGKVRAIELGAGIGRFTGYLADLCSLLTSVDFIKTFVDKNRKINGHRKNVTFRQEDITLLENPRNSFELVFSNWLFMYLSDFEVVQAFFKLIDWLTEGGIFFFRESCYHKSGDRGSSFKNPTHYRTPGDYQRLLYLANLLYKDASTCFKLCTEYVVKAYVKLKNNGNQRVFVCRKVVEQKEKEISQAFQEFLDSQQYSVNNIKRYEQLFGKGFVSTGGLETTKEFALLLDIKKDDFILDVGSGIGGSARYFAETFGSHVLGIDLSRNMVALAKANAEDCSRVNFKVEDCTTVVFPDNCFDIIYSRDTILHIQDKLNLFKKFYSWLRPGGRLLITDYCRGESEGDDEFKAYVKQRGYVLLTVKQYYEHLLQAGFAEGISEDRTAQFIEILEGERARLMRSKVAFLTEFTEKDYRELLEGWTAKINRCKANYQAWGLWMVRKNLKQFC